MQHLLYIFILLKRKLCPINAHIEMPFKIYVTNLRFAVSVCRCFVPNVCLRFDSVEIWPLCYSVTQYQSAKAIFSSSRHLNTDPQAHISNHMLLQFNRTIDWENWLGEALVNRNIFKLMRNHHRQSSRLNRPKGAYDDIVVVIYAVELNCSTS